MSNYSLFSKFCVKIHVCILTLTCKNNKYKQIHCLLNLMVFTFYFSKKNNGYNKQYVQGQIFFCLMLQKILLCLKKYFY